MAWVNVTDIQSFHLNWGKLGLLVVNKCKHNKGPSSERARSSKGRARTVRGGVSDHASSYRLSRWRSERDRREFDSSLGLSFKVSFGIFFFWAADLFLITII